MIQDRKGVNGHDKEKKNYKNKTNLEQVSNLRNKNQKRNSIIALKRKSEKNLKM